MSVDYRNTICYLDTNIFIYLFDAANPQKQRVSKELLLHFHRQHTRRISVQVLSEWRNVMIKKFNHLFDKNVRRQFIRNLAGWKPLKITPQILVEADKLCDRCSLSPYDSIHVQCALNLGCQSFLSEDMQDGVTIDGTLTIYNPYKGRTP